MKLTWGLTSLLVRSPLVRLAVAVPTVGYFILYGDAFAEMFDFTASLGAEHLLFDAQTKVRMIYYGGLMIGAALLIYLWKCPYYCRRCATVLDAMEQFSRTGDAESIKIDSVNMQYSDAGVRYDALHLAKEILSQTQEIDLLNFYESRSGDSIAAKIKEFGSPYELPVLITANMTGDAAEKAGLLTVYEVRTLYNAVIDMFYNRCATVPSVTSGAQIMAAHMFYADSRTAPIAQFFVAAASIAGLLLAALPAIDVFLQVVLTDTGLISLIKP